MWQKLAFVMTKHHTHEHELCLYECSLGQSMLCLQVCIGVATATATTIATAIATATAVLQQWLDR